jgi:hypothetical protein
MISKYLSLTDTLSNLEIYNILGELFQSAIKEYNSMAQFVEEVMSSIFSCDSEQTDSKISQDGGKADQKRARGHHHF